MPPSEKSFAEVLAAALQESGLTLDGASSQLSRAGTPVSIATLSYWQTGQSTPRRARSLKAIDQLERILDLPTGSLSEALPQSHDRAAKEEDIRPSLRELARVITEMDLDGVHWLGITNSDRVIIDAGGAECQVFNDQVVMAPQDGLSRTAAIYFQDAEGPASPVITAEHGCRVGHHVQIPERRLVVAELIFPRELQRDELHSFGYRVDSSPSNTPCFRYERALRNKHRTNSLTVTFEGEPPARATSYYLPRPFKDVLKVPKSSGRLPGTDLVVAGAQIEAVTLDSRPGIHGAAWRWS